MKKSTLSLAIGLLLACSTGMAKTQHLTLEQRMALLEEQHSVVPGLLHKYHNRALLLVKGGCAVNCRYCFRRHFPYAENQGNKRNWQTALEYVAAHPELDEMIFSGLLKLD